MTSDQHIALVEVGNEFYRAFGKLVADSLNKLPKEIETDALYYLGDMTSVFGSRYRKHLDENRK